VSATPVAVDDLAREETPLAFSSFADMAAYRDVETAQQLMVYAQQALSERLREPARAALAGENLKQAAEAAGVQYYTFMKRKRRAYDRIFELVVRKVLPPNGEGTDAAFRSRASQVLVATATALEMPQEIVEQASVASFGIETPITQIRRELAPEVKRRSPIKN
jgi:hypothetical protein